MEVIRGDEVVGSPFTSPFSLNLELADGWNELGGPSDQDPAAFTPLDDVLLANQECE